MTKTECQEVADAKKDNPTQEEIRLLRRLRITKLLQNKQMRIGEIAEHFGVDERTIRSDIDALRMGLDFLGVRIKIESKHQGNQKHYYKSTVHPVFLALNISEVLALLNLLEDASEFNFSGSVYGGIFNKVFSQLTDYAKERIHDKLKKGYDSAEIQNLPEEDAVKTSEHHAIVYLFKSGKHVSVSFANETDTTQVVQITDVRADTLTLRTEDGTKHQVGYDDVIIHWHNIDYK